jgi:hypothetical protein
LVASPDHETHQKGYRNNFLPYEINKTNISLLFFVYLGTLARPRVITFCAKLKAYIGARLPKKEAK